MCNPLYDVGCSASGMTHMLMRCKRRLQTKPAWYTFKLWKLSLGSTGMWKTADTCSIFVRINISAASQTSSWTARRRPDIPVDLTACPGAGEQTVYLPAQARALMNISIAQVDWPTAATHFYMVLVSWGLISSMVLLSHFPKCCYATQRWSLSSAYGGVEITPW